MKTIQSSCEKLEIPSVEVAITINTSDSNFAAAATAEDHFMYLFTLRTTLIT